MLAFFFLERAYSRSWDGSVQAHCRRRFGHQKGGACLVGWYPYEVRSPVKEIYIRFFSFNQAAFECMYTLLDTCLDRLDIFEFLSHVEDGLKDHYDIKVREISWLYCLILDFAVSECLVWRFYEDTSFCAPFWQCLFGRVPPFFVIIRSSSRSRLSLACRRRTFFFLFFFFYRPREKTRDFFR